MVLGKLSVPGCLTDLDNRAYFVCSRGGWGLFDIFALVHLFSSFSLSLSLSGRRSDID